jgi:hypothetical protein
MNFQRQYGTPDVKSQAVNAVRDYKLEQELLTNSNMLQMVASSISSAVTRLHPHQAQKPLL